MSVRCIRVGVIGTGRIAGFVHVPSLRLLPDLCEVTAVASRDPGKAKAFAEQWGISRVHDTWEALVADPELIFPGPDPGGIIVTALLGLVGSMVGTFVGRALWGGADYSAGWITSILGTIVILTVYRAVKRRQTA